MTIATDTGNKFADPTTTLQNAANIAASGTIKPVAASADATNSQNAYRDAWDAENHGQYGDINQGVLDAVPTPAAPAAKTFTQQNDGLIGAQQAQLQWLSDPKSGWTGSYESAGANGGYGTFKYGMPMPAAGTEQYRDMSEFFNNGGNDVANIYGRGKPAAAVTPFANAGGT